MSPKVVHLVGQPGDVLHETGAQLTETKRLLRGAFRPSWVSVWQEVESVHFHADARRISRVAFRIFIGILTLFTISGVANNPAPAGRA
jgi:hypothetical protein